MSRQSTAFAALLALSVGAGLAAAPQRGARGADDEAATARRLGMLRDQPLPLQAFLRAMPKGGDLHGHLSGSVYAESYLRWAAEDNQCLAVAIMTIVAGPCDAAEGRPRAASVFENAALYDRAIDAMSMRHWNQTLNGRDHFFATFAKFGPSALKTGDMLAEVTARAAREHLSYLELMLTPAGNATARFASDTGWNADLAAQRRRLLAAGFREAVSAEARQRLDAAEGRRRELQRCDKSEPDAGCRVVVRYITQVLRTSAPEQVFAQMLAGFELAAGAEARLVSVTLVQAEDDPVALRDFTLHMSMLDFLHRQYPGVPITLHAGELTEGLVPPEALSFHVRQSIETGHASRIGHGVDLMDEDEPFALLRDMAAKRVLVEVALTSNAVILGVRGRRHPLRTFLRYGVPVALVTDDAGVFRSTYTTEFLRAVEEHGLDYVTLKQLARNSVAYAFVDAANKARLQADLESAFRAFERQQATAASPPDGPSGADNSGRSGVDTQPR